MSYGAYGGFSSAADVLVPSFCTCLAPDIWREVSSRLVVPPLSPDDIGIGEENWQVKVETQESDFDR